jgi:hypothetical protein
MQRDNSPPKLHECDAYSLCDELDYEDMIALSGLYRQWAIYETKFSPEQRTKLIAWSADLERLAKWAGENWRASDPSPEMPLLKFLANWVRSRSSVIKLEHAKHWLGVSYRV